MLLHQKTAIVTGAGGGLGAAQARLFAKEGAQVVLTDIDAAAGQRVADEIGAQARFVPHDVAKEADWATVIDVALRAFGSVNILVNNAGVPGNRALQDTDTAFMRRVMEINMMGPFHGMRAVIEPMTRAGGGAIVNISSTVAFASFPGFFAYGATKWAVRGMTRMAAKDLAEYGIRVITLAPGPTDTQMLLPSVRENATSFMPFGRVGTPEEFARVALFAVSDAASYVSGAEITVDGALNC